MPVVGGPGAGNSVLDVPAALARMGGLSKLYLRAARDFLQALPGQVAELPRLAEQDSAQCAMQAHTLKGTAALLGALDLSEIASHLEKQCKNGVPGPARAATLERLALLAQVTRTQLLEATLQMEHSAAPAPQSDSAAAALDSAATALDRPALQATLAQLVPELEAADLSALDTFASQRAALVAVPETLLNPLEEALQDLDLELALAACRHIQQWLSEAPDSLQQIRDT